MYNTSFFLLAVCCLCLAFSVWLTKRRLTKVEGCLDKVEASLKDALGVEECDA